MSRLARTLALVVVLSALLGACASSRYSRRLELPPGARLYVAVFVDETDEGRLGVPLADAVRMEVYRRDPERLAMTFDDGTWALDGTVLALEEAPSDEGRMQLTVRARARLLDKSGDVVAVLGPGESTASYRLSRERAETERRRLRALDDAIARLAREIVRRVEHADDQVQAAAPAVAGHGVVETQEAPYGQQQE